MEWGQKSEVTYCRGGEYGDVGGIYDMSGVENLLSPAAEFTPTLAHVARVRLAST